MEEGGWGDDEVMSEDALLWKFFGVVRRVCVFFGGVRLG